jgi:hypothetical protein
MFFKNKEQKEIEKTLEMSINPEVIKINQEITEANYHSGMQTPHTHMGMNNSFAQPTQNVITPLDVPNFLLKEFGLIKFFNIA